MKKKEENYEKQENMGDFVSRSSWCRVPCSWRGAGRLLRRTGLPLLTR